MSVREKARGRLAANVTFAARLAELHAALAEVLRDGAWAEHRPALKARVLKIERLAVYLLDDLDDQAENDRAYLGLDDQGQPRKA